jgi:hypothetical protein
MKTALMSLILIIMTGRVIMGNFNHENPLSLTKQEIIEIIIASIVMTLIHYYL